MGFEGWCWDAKNTRDRVFFCVKGTEGVFLFFCRTDSGI